MSNDDDMLEPFDLSAWEAPPPPADLADAVIDRMGGTDVGIAVPVDEPRVPRRSWIIGGVAIAIVVLALGVWSLVRATHPAAPASGGVVADKARSLSLDTVHADLDPGADVRWRREGSLLRVEQRAGNVTWHVDADEKLVIDAGATSASVEATGANLRVEVQMNATDAKVIGASALTAAAVAMVTVVVYEGHVKVGTPNQQTVVVAPGTTYKVNATDDTAPTVGAAPVIAGDKRVAILGLELTGSASNDAPVVTQVLGSEMRAVAKRGEGPYQLSPGSDKELVDVKLLFNCESEQAACMAAVGADLGADVLVYGKLEQAKGAYTIRLQLLDVATKQVARTNVATIPIGEAEGEQLTKLARKLYLELVGAAVTTCDADTLKEQGMQHINMGQHAAALASFEASLACKHDPYVLQLAFMESCASGNSPKAKLHYKRLSPTQQAKFAQMCIRNKVAYEGDTATADSCAGVDEVSCVLTNYEGDCCEKYKQPSKPDGLTRADISAGIAKIKAKVAACGDQPNPGGKLVAKLTVRPNGSVETVQITTTPSANLSACVKRVLDGARFAQTKNGGAFSYPFGFVATAKAPAVPSSASCDPNALKDAGMQNINLGQHAAALAKFEASLRCKKDPYVIQLAYMEACASSNSAKAKQYFKLMTPAQQAKFSQMCERNNVAYLDEEGEGYLNVFSEPPARIEVDGKDTGMTTPIDGQELMLSAGKHKITFIVRGERFTYTAYIKAGKTATISKDLQ
jgi:hypothetical protein